MKRWLQRIAVAMMSIALVLTMIPLAGGAAFAETPYTVKTGGAICHLFVGETGASVIIEGASGTDTQLILPTSVTVPETGKTYDADSNGFFYVEAGAFKDNTKLTKVAIPKGYEGVDSSAFEGCTSLTEAAIGDGVKLGENVFRGCTNLTTYYLSGDNPSPAICQRQASASIAAANPLRESQSGQRKTVRWIRRCRL